MKVSIVIPTYNGEDVVAECLRGVFAQQHIDFETEVLVIDSSSSDRTPEIVKQFPVRFHQIRQSEFSHGDTRNLGAMMTDGDLIVFLVQDAYPERRDWLRTIVDRFVDPELAGLYCRVVERPTASLLVRKGVQGDLNYRTEEIVNKIEDPQAYRDMDPLERRIYINFNDVASCLRRSVWERLPFARVSFGEDLLWARGALEAGYRVRFEPNATVVHSHEYDPSTLRARTSIDAWLNRAYLDRECIRRRRDVLIMTSRVAKEDRRFLRNHGLSRFKRFKLGLLAHYYHFLEFWGFYQGSQTPDRLRCPQAVPNPKLKILFVVHGFPPETMAGTEVLTLSLAKGLQAAGHEICVFHRVAGEAGAENYSVSKGTYDGLRVIRVVNQLAFNNIEETYRNPAIERRFREVLAAERPDVVHFEHLIHLSATLPRICREENIGSVVTLNDFWFRCPKVQLIRPDRKVCRGKPPILGCAACVAERPGFTSALKLTSRPIRGLLHRAGKRYLTLVKKAPKHFYKHASDLSCLSIRPRTMIDELCQADFIIAPSPFLKAKMAEAGVPAERLIVSDYGMETGWLDGYRREPAKPGVTRFGFIGSLVWYKGLEVLAQAFQRLEEDGAELHIHGDTEGMPEFKETRRRIEEHVKRSGLHFHGRYAPTELAGVLGRIDVLVVPSIWYENSPLAIHEAFQAGIPVLVSDRGGMRDLVDDGHGGLRFAPGDDRDLARVMKRFLDEPGLAAELIAASPAVKSVPDNVAEMEIKYRQAKGIHLAHSAVFLVPASNYQRAEGEVETQAGELVLLRPGQDRNGGSLVEYEVMTPTRLRVDLNVRTRHFAGEGNVIQGGEVLMNGRSVLRIPPLGGGDDERDHDFWVTVAVPKGRNKVVIRNRLRGVGGGDYFLRLSEVSLHRTGSRAGTLEA